MKVALVHNGISQYSVIQHMEEALVQALLRAHIGVVSISLDEKGYRYLYRLLEQEDILCTLSLNQVIGKTIFYDTFFVPHVLLSIDALFWHSLLDVDASHIIGCFPDPESVSFLNKDGKSKSFYFPHACAPGMVLQMPDQKKTIPFLLPASYLDEEHEYALWAERWGATVAKKLADEAFRVLSEPETPFFDAAFTAFHTHVSPSDTSSSYESLRTFFCSFERFVRGVDRSLLLEKLHDETIHVATDQASFLRYQKRHPRLRWVYEGKKSFEDMLTLFSSAECVLHTLPPSFRHAFHERVLYALALGCRLYSTTMFSLPDWMREEQLVSYYDKGDPTPRCSNPEVFHKAKAWIEERHTWDVRVNTILQKVFHQAAKIKRMGQEEDPFARFRAHI